MQAQAEAAGRAAGVRLSRRRAARLCRSSTREGWPSSAPTPRSRRCSAKGYLAITFDLAATGERYQGIVPLEGESLARRARPISPSREQVPTLIRVAHPLGRRALRRAAGCWCSICPKARKGASGCTRGWTIPNGSMLRCLPGAPRHDELVDPDAVAGSAGLAAVPRGSARCACRRGCRLTRGCRCSVEHYRGGADALSRGRARRDAQRRRGRSWSIARSVRSMFAIDGL